MTSHSPSVVGYDDGLLPELAVSEPVDFVVAPPVYSGDDIRRVGVAYDGSPEADAALRAADSLASDRNAALTVYCVVGSTSIPVGAAIGTAARTCGPETQILVGVPAEEIAGRAYGVVDVLFVHQALLDNACGALVRAAGCPVVVS